MSGAWIGRGLIFLGSFAAMEAFAWAVHKHVMHGPLWTLHRSHHRPRRGPLERNDWFHLAFALPSAALLYLALHGQSGLLPAACGVTAYGLANWAFHDVLVHRRIPHGWLPRRGYLSRIVRAHYVHHRARERDGAVSFGFFYAPRAVLRAAAPGRAPAQRGRAS
jgi:beta-carotene 3-hydroxylase